MRHDKPPVEPLAHPQIADTGLIIHYGLRTPQEDAICDATHAHLLIMPEERCEAEFSYRAPDGIAKTRWMDGRRVIFVPKNVRYKMLWKKTAALVRMTISDAFIVDDAAIQRKLVSVQILHESQLSSRDSLVCQLFHQFEERCPAAAFPNANHYINSAGHLFAVHALKIFEGSETVAFSGLPIPSLRRVQAYVEQNMSEKIYVEDMAREANLRPHHFTRLFKVSTSMTPHFYLFTQRCERAQRLLAEKKMSAVEVALDVGFCEESYLWYALKVFAKLKKQEA